MQHNETVTGLSRPRNRGLLAVLALIIVAHIALIIARPSFPHAWGNIGGILLCLGIAYPLLPPGSTWVVRGHTWRYRVGFAILMLGSLACTFVLGRS